MVACAALETATGWAQCVERIVWARRRSRPEIVRFQKPTSVCDAHRVCFSEIAAMEEHGYPFTFAVCAMISALILEVRKLKK